MPTVTTLSQISIFNVGPLTTTFTTPASCIHDTWLAAPAEGPKTVWYALDCRDVTVNDCAPSTAALKSHIPSDVASNPAAHWIPYYSPGVVCPSGYQTVGVAVKVNPTSTSMSGMFTRPTSGDDSEDEPTSGDISGHGPMFNPGTNVLMDALDPGETAVMCCPSSYIADAHGLCWSALPTSVPKPTEYCERLIPNNDLDSITATFPLYGQTVTAEVFTFTATSPIILSTQSLSATDAASMVLVGNAPPIIMVHQASDVSSAGKGKGGGSGASETNAAAPGAHMGGGGGGMAALVAVWCAAVAAGAMLMVPF
ncbi:hypothetical protein QBC33DRAFT_599929 [Phialemonium atrogriseum]|uniref:Uncharacterized protein n=1 Tax=Phialemonium atrogriseum TaxID=1093897 RepID=A0AAJ0BQR5_9PEZI|nr:uncharacterized protein QBC33DRAFT_599929 [Phialemonium atrogriseum]KAK1762743.1 hypothetical protein QBC33DRAFT_599929 [Phialemonium atrogriseum]